jgi:hypothetical protein
MSQPNDAVQTMKRLALLVFSRTELVAMTKIQRSNLGIMIDRRLKQGGEPTLAEMQGIRHLHTTFFS